MVRKSQFLTELDKFIEQAALIGKQCSDEHVRRSHNTFLAVDIHNEYIIWKLEFDAFLQKAGFSTDAKLFRVENSVPLLKGGIEYGDKDSEESRALIKAISVELDEKLRHIREIYQREHIKKIAAPSAAPEINLNFYFNKQDGELTRYPKEILGSTTFTVGEGRYKILVILIEEKQFRNEYVPTEELQNDGGYKSTQKCREAIHSIRAMVEDTFKGIKGDEFIEAKKGSGYRIGKEMRIEFTDTP